ncbi:kinase-like protein [Hysterangium stoloniferum]|nr:kinase-like protein [Hysterangium stoloniferum]
MLQRLRSLLLLPLNHIRLSVYRFLSTATGFHNIRYFKFGIPLVLKCSIGTIGTEADALRFLNSCGLRLPIPRIVDSFVVGGNTYTVMTRIDGDLLIDKLDTTSDKDMRLIVEDVFTVLRSLWTLPQPEQDAGKVMLSASGHGMPSPVFFFEDREGPFDNILECFVHLSRHLFDSVEEFKELQPNASQTIMSDTIVYVHADLRSHNILVKDGRLSGIIDWENSGWLPLHWQLHVLRRPCASTRGEFRKLVDSMKGPSASEAAYEESKPLLYYNL